MSLNQILADRDISPTWVDDVPYCSHDDCKRFDGKRCEILGEAPTIVCGPTVAVAKAIAPTWRPMPEYVEATHGTRVLLDLGTCEVVIGEYHAGHKCWLGKFGVVAPRAFMVLPKTDP